MFFYHHGLRVPEVCGRIKGLLWQGHLPHMTIIITRKKVHQYYTLLVLFILNLQDHTKKLLVY